MDFGCVTITFLFHLLRASIRVFAYNLMMTLTKRLYRVDASPKSD